MGAAPVSANPKYTYVEKTVTRKGKTFKQWYRMRVKEAPAANKLAIKAAKTEPAAGGSVAERLVGAKKKLKKAEPDVAERLMAKKIGGQLGSNEGGTYEGKDGLKRYVKHYKDPTQALQETIANKIYKDLGHDVPTTTLFDHGGRKSIASELVDGKKLEESLREPGEVGHAKIKAQAFLKGFMGDALTGNWDAAGLTMDNALVTPKGQVVRVDTGGSLLQRASGGKKPEHLLDKVTEWEGFFDHKMNPSYAALASMAGVKRAEDLGDQLHKDLAKIQKMEKRYGDWAGYVKQAAPGIEQHPAELARIAQMLTARTRLLEQKVDKVPPGDPGPGWQYVQKEVLKKGKVHKQWFRVKDAQAKALAKTSKLRKFAPKVPLTPEEMKAEIDALKVKLRSTEAITRKEIPEPVFAEIQNHANENWRKLSDDLKGAMRGFTGGDYPSIRAHQAGMSFEQAKEKLGIDDNDYEKGKRLAPLLEQAQAHMVLHEPTKYGALHRGMNVSRETLHAMLTGDAITHNGFSANSTSYSRQTAEGFLYNEKSYGSITGHREYPVMLVYKRVKSGTNMNHPDNYHSEQEIALGKGTFKITGRRYVTDSPLRDDRRSYFEIEVEEADD